ncbi:MAG: carboxypeptidase regulatory-like domain-containing protein [Candidatus Competibacter sp.]|nr:carboxypeptidase regulatory-like domain-containing protein [Candidatus Competibacter sp.]
MGNRILVHALLAAGLSVAVGPAWAHKLKAFATAEGATLVGYAYFSSGGRPRQASVTVTDAEGGVLATTITDDEGNFRVEAKRRIDHRITVDGGDGHAATYTVTASELPDTLPTGGGRPAAPVSVATVPTDPPTEVASLAVDAGLRAFIDQSVSRQIRPLREQIDAYQEKIGWHDVLGGIGYIIGLGGLAFGLSERRRRTDSPPPAGARRSSP